MPTQWGQYESIVPVLNPAFAGKDEDLGVTISNLRHFGLWKNNQTYLVNANFRILSKSRIDSVPRKNFQVLGAYVIGEDEGQYLHRTRGYGTYAYHLRISKSFNFAAGLSLGFMSYSISANDYNSGGVSTTVDGNLGLLVYSSKYYFGLSSNQIFEGFVTPIQERTRLLRHWNLNIGSNFTINQWLEFKPNINIRFLPGLNPNVNLGTTFILGKWVAIGSNYRHKESVTILFGLERLPFGQSKIKALVSYNIPLAAYTSPALQAFEILIKYSLNYKSKIEIKKNPADNENEEEK